MSSTDEVRDRIEHAIAEALSSETEMVTGYVALIEVVDSTGERAMYTMVPGNAKAWDTLGLLTYGLQLEQAASLRDDD